ncbi:MAG: hypothetical protein GX639_01090, partial [Fibrobacter sp.]|nr:hypothetical protein [Fibrobacter sp.]
MTLFVKKTDVNTKHPGLYFKVFNDRIGLNGEQKFYDDSIVHSQSRKLLFAMAVIIAVNFTYAATPGSYIQGDGSGGGGGGASSANGGSTGGGNGGDGGGSSTTINGTAGDDVIFGDGSGGGAGSRTVSYVANNNKGGLGGSGDDVISGNEGDDVIFGDGFNGIDYGGWTATAGGLGGGGGGGGGGLFGGAPWGGPGGLGGGSGGGGANSGGSSAVLVNGFGNLGGSNAGTGGNSATSVGTVTGSGGAADSYAGGGGGGFGGAAGGSGGQSGLAARDGAHGGTGEHRFSDASGSIKSYFTEEVLRNVLTNYRFYGSGNDIIDGGAGSNELFGLGGSNTFIIESDDNATHNRIWDFKVGDKLLLKTDGTTISAISVGNVLSTATYGDYDGDGENDDTRFMFNGCEVILINTNLTSANNQGSNGEIEVGNSAPDIDLPNTALSYIYNGDNGWFSSTSLNDKDGDADWIGGTLVVQITSNADNADQLGLHTHSTSPTISISGTSLSVDGVVVATLSQNFGAPSSNSYGYVIVGSAALTITFNANATNRVVSRIMENLCFKSNATGNGNRTITVTANDKYAESASDTRVIGTRPVITTQAVSSISATTATGNGTITDLGVPNPTAHGVCWHTSTGPTTANSVVDNGGANATGAFTASMTGLTPGTTYYVRAYATNSAGTAYGDEVTFTTLKVPVVTTQAVSSIAATTATGNGIITDL